MESLALIDWSRAQFALTAMYHWIFVPLTLGLSFIVAIMETIYYKTGSKEWEKITKFWMNLFGINFAIGLATGIIMEFEFGTNWSNYSWMVGDIFGAPLAIEGIMAFFMESTFFAVMFFGWKRVGKKMHLLSTWLVAIGSNLSALWILTANGWMQHPVGMKFNVERARFEMQNFWDVLFNPTAYSKFLHVVSSGYVLASLFVVGISAWFILKGKELLAAKKSLIIGASFGLIASLFLVFTGDASAKAVALTQPAKLAAMEGIYDGKKGEGIVAFGILNLDKKIGDKKEPFLFKIEIPKLLSLLSYHDANAFVAGVDDLVYGNNKEGIKSASSKIQKGKIAIDALKKYKKAKANGDRKSAKEALNRFRKYEKYFGYGYLNNPKEIIPPVALTFYSFHIMVGLGFCFVLLFLFVLYFAMRGKIESKKWLLQLAIFTIPLGYLAQELGWVVAEVGRQPWAIEGMLPVKMASSHVSVGAVQFTFWLFAFIFTLLLIAEVGIMSKQIKIGIKE